MSYREIIEQDIKSKIVARLDERGASFKRAWLNPSNYPHPISFEDGVLLDAMREARIVIQTHSYEVFDYDEEEIKKYIDLSCSKIEDYFIRMISDREGVTKFAFIEGDLNVSLEYRVTIISLAYNLAEGVVLWNHLSK